MMNVASRFRNSSSAYVPICRMSSVQMAHFFWSLEKLTIIPPPKCGTVDVDDFGLETVREVNPHQNVAIVMLCQMLMSTSCAG